MHNSQIPSPSDLPTSRQLGRSTLLAFIVATVLMITIVLPAEYGRDPTGIGTLLGLTNMGEIKQSLASEAAREKETAAQAVQALGAAQPPSDAPIQEATPQPAAPTHTAEATGLPTRSDEMSVTLAPNEGTEIKVELKKGHKVSYNWVTSGGKANFDVHGDSEEQNIDYHGYKKGSKERDEGVIEAAFDGNHGWFWRNRTPGTMTIILQANGEYTAIKQLK